LLGEVLKWGESMMKKAPSLRIDLAKADAKLRAWRKKYDTPEKVAALHRKAILKHVLQSMAFEGQPVSMARLKALLKEKEKVRFSSSYTEQKLN
jgi:hypothetical protein